MNRSTRDECESIASQLWPYLDGFLPDSEKDRVVSHLEDCLSCTSHLDFATSFLDAVHNASFPEGEFVAVRARVMKALIEEGFAAQT